MGTPQQKRTGYTIEDWKTWEGSWELIGGEAYPTYGMAPAPSLEHQRIATRLVATVWTALEEARRKGGGGECEAIAAPRDVRLGADIVQPDLVVVCDASKKTECGIEGAPDLVAEILSPSTATRDLWQKRNLYEAAGVGEYLIVNPSEQTAVLLRLEAGRYDAGERIDFGATVALLGGRLQVSL